jgi:hypothetical protein
MNAQIIFELTMAAIAAMAAFFVSTSARRSKTKSAFVLSIIISLFLLFIDRIIWARTGMGLIDHATCGFAPDSDACADIPTQEARLTSSNYEISGPQILAGTWRAEYFISMNHTLVKQSNDRCNLRVSFENGRLIWMSYGDRQEFTFTWTRQGYAQLYKPGEATMNREIKVLDGNRLTYYLDSADRMARGGWIYRRCAR